MIEIFKFLKGYVVIKVWGFSPQRFLNLCSNKGILLWDITQNDGIYFMSISLKSFYSLRSIVKKTGTKVVIVKRCGLPFLVPKLLKRKTFIVCCILCFLFWGVSQQYVWKIQLEGNYQITTDLFSDFLEEENIKIGILKGKISLTELEKRIREQYPTITWTSAKFTGTTLCIDIKENTVLAINATEDEVETGKDIVANQTGKITSILVRKGVPTVVANQEVEIGDILVTGLIPIIGEDGTVINYQIADSDADITIQYVQNYEASILKKYETKVYTGNERKETYLVINLNKYRIGAKTENYEFEDCIIEEKKFSIATTLSLPIYLETITYKEYNIKEDTYSKEEGAKVLLEELNLYLKNFVQKGVQIIEKNVRIEETGTEWIFRGELVLVGPCGEKQDLIVPEIEKKEEEVASE